MAWQKEREYNERPPVSLLQPPSIVRTHSKIGIAPQFTYNLRYAVKKNEV